LLDLHQAAARNQPVQPYRIRKGLDLPLAGAPA
jgi:hypothetical protein